MSTARVPFDELTVADDQSMEWKGKPFTGIAYETNAAGKVISEVPFVDGVEMGVAREWFDLGQLRSESHRSHGSRHGISKAWHDNGQLKSESEHRYSIKVREKVWSRDGTLTRDWALPEDDPQRGLIEQLAKQFGEG